MIYDEDAGDPNSHTVDVFCIPDHNGKPSESNVSERWRRDPASICGMIDCCRFESHEVATGNVSKLDEALPTSSSLAVRRSWDVSFSLISDALSAEIFPTVFE